MTFIAAYKHEEQVLLISDFRVTFSMLASDNRYLDTVMKFKQFDDKKLGIFFAGDVKFWQETILLLEALNDVTFNNVLAFNGPLRETLNDHAMSYTGNNSGAIAFILDEERGLSIVFRIHICAGSGVKIEEIPPNTAIIMGSGSLIPNIHSRINICIEEFFAKFRGIQLCEIGNPVREEILKAIDESGSSTYRKLGISPLMAISVINGSHFHMVGEEFSGVFSSLNNFYEYSYSFYRNPEGRICINLQRDIEYIVHDDLFTVECINEIIDPAGRLSRFDFSEIHQDSDYCYLLFQWVSEYGLYRSLERIQFETEYRFNEHSERISDINEVAQKELHFYPNCVEIHFVIDEILLSQFEENVCRENLFNHEWLNTYLPNYYSTFYLMQ